MAFGCLTKMTSKNYKQKALELVNAHGYEKAFSVAQENSLTNTEWLFILNAIVTLSRKERRSELSKEWIVPPFSVINTHKSYYKKLVDKWKKYGLGISAIGRNNNLIGVQSNIDGTKTIGTSIFNPALANIVYEWFLDEPSTVFDPFCGGPERGIVAAELGHKYIGIDIREEQIQANYNAFQNTKCKWIVSDATEHNYPNCDMIFTCPPYYNLEVYSDLQNDLSNQESYNDFINLYKIVIEKCCKASHNWVCFVVGNIRENQNLIIDFPGDTIRVFNEYGYGLLNEIIIYAVGSASVRTNFKNKKLTNVHQKILVFKRD